MQTGNFYSQPVVAWADVRARNFFRLFPFGIRKIIEAVNKWQREEREKKHNGNTNMRWTLALIEMKKEKYGGGERKKTVNKLAGKLHIKQKEGQNDAIKKMIPGIKKRRCKRHTPFYPSYTCKAIRRPATKFHSTSQYMHIIIILCLDLRDFMIEQCFIFNSRICNRPERRSLDVDVCRRNDAIEMVNRKRCMKYKHTTLTPSLSASLSLAFAITPLSLASIRHDVLKHLINELAKVDITSLPPSIIASKYSCTTGYEIPKTHIPSSHRCCVWWCRFFYSSTTQNTLRH